MRLTRPPAVGHVLRGVVLPFSILLVMGGPAPGQRAPGQLSGRWLGQIEQDRVGPSREPGPSGVQDIVIALEGLPSGAEVARVEVHGEGADIWEYGGDGDHFAADLVHRPGERRALVYVEPTRPETGRQFHVIIALEDGREADFYLRGGRADPSLRMPEARLSAVWAGGAGSDLTSPGPAVGPDGREDVRVDLRGIATGRTVEAVVLRADDGSSWSFGPNPRGEQDAVFARDENDPARGSLVFSAPPELRGRRLRVDLRYDNDTSDRAELLAGDVPADRPVEHGAMPRIEEGPLEIRWAGPAEDSPLGPGAQRIEVSGFGDRRLAAAVLGDGVSGCWVVEVPDDRGSRPDPLDEEQIAYERRPMVVAPGSRPGVLRLDFVPVRDEAGAAMTLRLIDGTGQNVIGRFEGQPCDPLERFAPPGPSTRSVAPGEDLAAAVARGGTVRLSTGVHRLDRPLVLDRPVTLVGDPDAELRFRQRGEESWPEAIAIRGAGRTTLRGFRVRFEGPIRWDRSAPWGPAVIGLPLHGMAGGPAHVSLRDLDIEGPVPGTDWEGAPLAFRLIAADSGEVVGNRLACGSIELEGGPWTIAGNTHDGPRAGTFAHSVLSGHNVHDLEIVDNVITPGPGAGKLWRFLVLTGRGIGVRVEGNRVERVGPRDDDDRPHPNAPEVVLTESYALRFEGRHAGLSADGLVLAIPDPPGGPVQPGDVVAVLSGPGVGRWSRVAQVLDRRHLLLGEPLPGGADDVAVTPGFLGMAIRGNTIDCPGSSEANLLVLTGNHYGTEVAGNTLRGGRRPFEISSYATETPYHWGWSHTPALGWTVEDNTIVDPVLGGWIAVLHNEHTRAGAGRVYLSGAVLGNTFRWSGEGRGDRTALTIGQAPALDPGELVLRSGGNTATGPGGAAIEDPMRIIVGTVNGRAYGPGR